MGKSLLVTNVDIPPLENPDRWRVLEVFVGEDGLSLNRPRISESGTILPPTGSRAILTSATEY